MPAPGSAWLPLPGRPGRSRERVHRKTPVGSLQLNRAEVANSTSWREPSPRSERRGAIGRLDPILQSSAFRSSEYRRYFAGQSFSVIGTWMQSVAAAWLVLQLSHDSAFALALYGACAHGPVLLFGLVAGPLVDRFVHRDILLLTQLIAAGGAALLAGLTTTHAISLPVVYAIAVVLGANNALYFPARQATILEMVGRSDLASAVALNSTAFNLARIIGPAVGGLVIATAGVADCFWLNALSYLGVIVSLLTVRRRVAIGTAGQSTIRLIQEGLGYIRRVPALLGLYGLLLFAGVFGANFNLVLPLFTRVDLHAGADVLGYLFAAQGAGALIGALTMTAAGRYLLDVRRIVLGGLLFAALELIFLVTPGFGQAIALLLAIGWAFALYSIGTNTMVQILAPDRMQGRMVSLYSMLFIGTTPLGNFFAGGVAGVLGPTAAVWMGGALTAAAGLIVLLYFGRRKLSQVVA